MRQTAWQTLGTYLPRYLNPQHQTQGDIPPRTREDITELQQLINKMANKHTSKIAKATWAKFTKKINTLAQEDPKRMIR
jgi:hypothetical protein